MGQPFETARFFDTVTEVGDMLAELQYIDRARPYLLGLPWNAMFETHDVVLGRRYPFDIRISTEDEGEWAEVRHRLEGFADEAGARAQSEVEAVVDATRTLVGFDPGRHRTTVQQLVRIHDLLVRKGIQDLGLLERTLDDWTGSAADAFALDFYHPLEQVHTNQCYLLSESAKAMTMAIGVYETAQDALMNAVLAARLVLDEQLRTRAGGGGGSSTEDFLTVAAAAIAVATSLRFVSPPVATTLSVASLAIRLAQPYAVTDKGVHETATIEASSADEAAAALLREVSHVRERTDRALSNLGGEFAPVRSEMSDRRLHPPRPALTADTPASAFRFQF